MLNILDSFLNYRLIENIDGNDERYKKLEVASEKLAQIFSDNPCHLIPAILAGISPKASLEMPIVAMAKDCIQQEWKSVSSAYTDEPINLYRGAILQACKLVSDKNNNASILWLTACDIFPTIELGKEKNILIQFMKDLAIIAEKNTILDEVSVKPIKEKPIKIEITGISETVEDLNIDKEKLQDLIGGAAGPQYTNTKGQNVASAKPNRYHPHVHPVQWGGDFSNLMSDIIISQLKNVNDNLNKNTKHLLSSTIEASFSAISESINNVLNSQRLSIQNYQKQLSLAHAQEQTKLNVLWWSEALYSTSHNKSYREFSPEISSIIMPYDLLEQVFSPSPASVAYGLSETVNKLPGAGFQQNKTFLEFLEKIKSSRGYIDETFIEKLNSDSEQPCLNVRDLICKVLTDEHCDIELLIENSLIPHDWQWSLPCISRAIFRQEQALKMAERNNE
ncbi:GTPase-associated system all-helical protein GASH [Pectobacterium brasiliense]|uniref:GTPase-associated system all-helical protein GASH n=1 Tax=Pectobacterium brasiliense TaxID=180957 RepID=UPI003EBB022D